ncbi:MAG: transposase [Iphinoe sp. HA4291-MV1]|jgi:putative transposase|nr:transposase [Iphinoe sp. HA4291-MV1]
MIVYEFKVKGKVEQYRKVDEAIRTFQFVRNKSIRFWVDNRGVKLSELSKLSAVLAKEFEFANKLNSQARQAATERASFAIQRFYDNCKSNKPGDALSPSHLRRETRLQCSPKNLGRLNKNEYPRGSSTYQNQPALPSGRCANIQRVPDYEADQQNTSLADSGGDNATTTPTDQQDVRASVFQGEACPNFSRVRPRKKGFPQFQKNNRSVEYKQTGWKLSDDRKYINFIDKCGIGKLKLIGTYDLHYYQVDQIKRVRIVRRSDGYYVQFCIQADRNVDTQPTGKTIGLDVGLSAFYTDSQGNKVENPRHLRKSEKALKRLQKRVSRKKKGSNNRKRAVKKLGRKHLKVSRQRKDHAVKQALCVVKSNDFVAFEKLQVRNMVKNHRLAKSINDAGWSQFTQWLEYFGKVYGRVVVSVPPQYTSQNCSDCGEVVEKSLSVRTHICKCGCVLDRDHNAAINILSKALKQSEYQLSTVGHTETNAWGETDLYLIWGNSVRQVDSLNQESHGFLSK